MTEESNSILKNINRNEVDSVSEENVVENSSNNENEEVNKQNSETKTANMVVSKTPNSKKLKSKQKIDVIPRGQPKSGRPWKSVKTKFSSIKKTIYRRNFEKKMEFRNELKHIKELSKSIKEQKKEENEMKKQRRLQNAQRKLENERKSEVVQIIKNPAKIKRMRKKQLRMIEKRDLSKVKVV